MLYGLELAILAALAPRRAVPAARAAPRCTGVHGADVHGRVVVKFGRWSMVVGLSRASQFVS